MNGFADSLVGSAAADVSCHGVVDIAVRGFRVRSEQRSGIHHLSGLAVTTLRDIVFHPRFLKGMEVVLVVG